MGFIEKIFDKLTNNKLIEWFSMHKWYTLGIGIFLLGGAVGIFKGFDMVVEGRINFFLTIPFMVLLTAGLGLVYMSFTIESMGTFGGFGGSQKVKVTRVGKKEPNTINVLVRKNDDGQTVPWKIIFTYQRKTFGLPHKLENDGKYYYFHILDLDKKKMVDVILPDTVYLDPRKYVIPLTMPADEAYWKPILTTWQKVAPFAIVLTIIIEWIVYITTKGGVE